MSEPVLVPVVEGERRGVRFGVHTSGDAGRPEQKCETKFEGLNGVPRICSGCPAEDCGRLNPGVSNMA